MKKIISLFALTIIFIASCKRDLKVYSPSYTGNGIANDISGNFVLTNFTNLNSNEDNTVKFNGYVFTFDGDGKIAAVKDNQTQVGSYTVTHTLGNNLELIFYFNDEPLNYLNGNWWVKSISVTSINLGDVSTGDVVDFAAQ